MCGLIGLFTKSSYGFSSKEVELFGELLFVDTVRGMDSTGVCAVRNTGQAEVLKHASWAPAVLSSKTFINMMKEQDKDGKILMGHNRKATVGNVTDANAHPFVVNDEFILMHNGSLPSHKHLDPKFEVDSEAIAHYLYEKFDPNASAEDKAKVLEFLGGAWALVWYDMRYEKLFMVRNAQRPLNMVHVNGTWVYASDPDMLKMCVSRQLSWAQGLNFRSIPTYTLVSFDGEELKEETLPFFAKASAPTTTIFYPTATQQKGGTTEAETPSKNEFKKTLRRILGTKITLSLDDIVYIQGKPFWYGVSGDIKIAHEVTGWCSDLDLLSKIEANYGMAIGRVSGGKFDKTTQTATFHVTLVDIDETAAID